MRPLLHPALVNGRAGDPAVELVAERMIAIAHGGERDPIKLRELTQLAHFAFGFGVQFVAAALMDQGVSWAGERI